MKMILNKNGAAYLIRVLLQTIIGAALFFIAAGKFDVLRGIIYFPICFIITAAGVLVIYGRNPELLNERARKRENTAGWDRILLPLYILLYHPYVFLL